MSRSKHTDPVEIRARRRLHAPREARSQDDASRRQRLGRLLKEAGLSSVFEGALPERPAIEPRLVRRRPRPGLHHPATVADIRRTLAFVGPVAVYGIRSVELAHAPTGGSIPAGGSFPALGQLRVPGRILLFEQGESPWNLRGRLSARESELVERAGALVEVAQGPWATRITWPAQTLRDFMLFGVLLHEVGHHALQHHKGKRTQRIARTKDHEAFADRFSWCCRKAWFEVADDPR